MASAWVETRKTGTGAVRYRVRYRVGGAESPVRYAGLFNTKREAKARQAWVLGQLAAMRVPDMDLLADESRAPIFREAAERWLASRIDVAESTKGNHRSAVAAIVLLLGSRRVDSIEAADVAELVASLCETRRRETVRKMLLVLG